MSTGSVKNIDASALREDYDFIVVGGGTAGNVVAGRLAENPDISLLVVEAGRGDPEKIETITTPARAFECRDGPEDWKYKFTMIDRPDYTRVEKPNTRGKVLGGSSCLNYYTWVRGSKGTFDDWEEFGGRDWNWDGVKEYFDKPVTYHDDNHDYLHVRDIGMGGPLHIEHADLVPELKPFRDALLTAWQSKGLKVNDDIYSGTMSGLTHCATTIYKGVRAASWSFLVGMNNVDVLAKSHGKRLVLDGKRATGVEILADNGNTITVNAKREVIVAAGVFESPKLLMLSGIGPEKELAEFHIRSTIDSPHVGKNLVDHPILSHAFRLKDGLALDDHLLRAGPQKEGAVRAYNRERTGPFGSGLLELVAFPRIDERLNEVRDYVRAKQDNWGKDPFGPAGQPHFEIDFVPVFADAFQWHFPVPQEGSWLTVIVDLLRPASKNGWVKLRSDNPLDDPCINVNFFEDHLDVIALREGVRFIDDILMNGDGFKEIIGEDYPWPMPRNSDEAMDKMILERAQIGFHPCGSCRLSKKIEDGVVDGDLKVHGLENVRVIDASVFPVIPDCRIQNAVYMVGEKGADLIKADHRDLYPRSWGCDVPSR
ncbi:CAZyme family AA3 [Aspergillus niger]|nr:CAZyme family AA3 [Aspergillus niger]